MTTPAPLLLSPRDAALALAVSPRTLWGLTSPRGPIPCIRLGRAVRYSPLDLQAWIDGQKRLGSTGKPEPQT